MSATAADGGDGAARDSDEVLTDHQYFRALEDFLIELRGAPLLISPADYRVAQRWHRRGIPLDHVRQVMHDVYARLRERQAEEPMNSLRYCARAVEASWSEVEALRAPGARDEVATGVDVAARLGNLASALPADLPGRAAFAERITALAGDVEHVEGALAGLDRELLAGLEGSLDDERRRALDASVEETVDALFGRLFAGDVDRARERLRRQLLRRDFDLPVLSLFAPEAESDESDSPVVR
ncbi:MAG TPA: hypothetical protein VM617_01375 [Thermoanaerobaculia bacterium]|nr:hypothetical protein [Thermoanaerobaculia bacterium]